MKMKKNYRIPVTILICLILLLATVLPIIYYYILNTHENNFRNYPYVEDYYHVTNPFFPNIEYPTPYNFSNIYINITKLGTYFFYVHSILREKSIIEVYHENGSLLRNIHLGSIINTDTVSVNFNKIEKIRIWANGTGTFVLISQDIMQASHTNRNSRYQGKLDWNIKTFFDIVSSNQQSKGLLKIQNCTIRIIVFDQFFNEIYSISNINEENTILIKPFNKKSTEILVGVRLLWVIINLSNNSGTYDIQFTHIDIEELNFCYLYFFCAIIAILMYSTIKYGIKGGKLNEKGRSSRKSYKNVR